MEGRTMTRTQIEDHGQAIARKENSDFVISLLPADGETRDVAVTRFVKEAGWLVQAFEAECDLQDALKAASMPSVTLL